jgi:DNA-directed RNA polymerase subunit K/omega
MSDFGGFGDGIDNDDDDIIKDTADISDTQPELEDIFQSGDLTEGQLGKKREGNDRIGKPFLGKLTKSKMIAARAKQLEIGTPSVIPPERLRSSALEKIATQEFDERVIPINVIRKYPDGTYEIWKITDFKYFVRT